MAAALGLGIGWLDLHTTEVSVTIVSLLLAGLLLGCYGGVVVRRIAARRTASG